MGKIVALVLDIANKGISFPGRGVPSRGQISSSLSRSNRKLSTKPSSPMPTQEQAKRRAASVMCSWPSAPTPGPQGNVCIEALMKLYLCLGIDKTYMARVIESEQYLIRDQLKRNKNIMKHIQQFAQKVSTHKQS